MTAPTRPATGASEAQVRMAEQIADALASYFDFGEGMRLAEWRQAYRAGEHIAARLPDHRIVGPDQIAAIARVATALAAILAYHNGMSSPEGIHARHRDASAALGALQAGDIELVLSIGDGE